MWQKEQGRETKRKWQRDRVALSVAHFVVVLVALTHLPLSFPLTHRPLSHPLTHRPLSSSTQNGALFRTRIIPSSRTWMRDLTHVYVTLEDTFEARLLFRHCRRTEGPRHTAFTCPDEVPTYVLTRRCTAEYYAASSACCKFDEGVDFLVHGQPEVYAGMAYVLHGDDDTVRLRSHTADVRCCSLSTTVELSSIFSVPPADCCSVTCLSAIACAPPSFTPIHPSRPTQSMPSPPISRPTPSTSSSPQFFRVDQVLRWLARLHFSGLDHLPLVGNNHRSTDLLRHTASRGVYHLQGCEEVVANGWYQPVMMNRAAVEVIRGATAVYGLTQVRGGNESMAASESLFPRFVVS